MAGPAPTPAPPPRRCLLVQAPPGSNPFHEALEQARRAGERAHLYLVDEASRGADLPEIERLAETGTRLFVCALSLRKRRLPSPGPYLIQAGLVLLRDLILHTGTLACFGLPPGPDDPPTETRWSEPGPRGLVLRADQDPSQSGAPAEALRLAAGLHRPGQLQIQLLLRGPAQTLLQPGCELLEGAEFAQLSPRHTFGATTRLGDPLPPNAPLLAMA